MVVRDRRSNSLIDCISRTPPNSEESRNRHLTSVRNAHSGLKFITATQIACSIFRKNSSISEDRAASASSQVGISIAPVNRAGVTGAELISLNDRLRLERSFIWLACRRLFRPGKNQCRVSGNVCQHDAALVTDLLGRMDRPVAFLAATQPSTPYNSCYPGHHDGRSVLPGRPTFEQGVREMKEAL